MEDHATARPPTSQSEERIQSLAAIVWEAEIPTLRLAYISDYATRLLGFAADRWLQEVDFWIEHIHPEDRAAVLQARADSIAQGKPGTIEYRMIAADSRAVWLRDVFDLHKRQGEPDVLRGVMVEITDSRTQAQALRRMTQLYAALTHINEVAVAVTDQEQLLARICEALVEFGKLKMVWIGWSRRDQPTVTIASQYGDTTGYLRNITVRSDLTPEGRGPFGQVLRTGKPCVLNDFTHATISAPWHVEARRAGLKAICAFPIAVGGERCGVLLGYAGEVDFFGPQESELLFKAANQISFALDHFAGEEKRKAAEAAMRQSELRFRRMFEDTADALMLFDANVQQITDCNQATVTMLRCLDKSEILGMHPSQFSPPLQADGSTSREMANELIGLTLRNGSHRFEWIHCSPRREPFVTEVLLTPILVDDLRLIVATVRDISERRRDEQRQAALYRISEAAQSTATLPELFPQIHAIIGDLLPAKNFFVALHQAEADELVFPYFVDEYDQPPGALKLNGGTLSGEVIRTGEALLLTPEDQALRTGKGKIVVGSESIDWLGVPLKSHAQTTGVLVVQSYSGDVRYTEKDKALLEFVSGQIAIAIERKQAEEALRISETRLRLILEQSQAGIFRTQVDGTIIECNDAFAELLGYESKTEIMNVNAAEFYFNNDERDTFVSRLHADGSVNDTVIRLRRKDGGEVWGMETVTLVRDHDGTPVIIQGTVTDFTERKRADEALRLSESRLEEAQRLAHLGSWNWDVATTVLSWSDELCRIFAVLPTTHSPSFDDFIARVHPEERTVVRDLIAQSIRCGKSFDHELRIVRPDGEVRTLFDQCELTVDGDGNTMSVAGACLDITARKLEEALEKDRSLILEQVAHNKPLPEILSHVATMLERQLPRTCCSIVLVRNGHWHVVAAPHLPADFVAAIEGMRFNLDVEASALAFLPGSTTTSENIATDSRWSGLHGPAKNHGLRACWSIAIPSSEGGVLGSLALYRDHPPAKPAGRELSFIEMATQLAAIAIEHRQLTDQLEHQAQHDALTGLPNRLLFRDRLNQALATAERKQQQVAILYMDLDRFKNINDTLGHSSGDALLKLATGRLSECIRSTDTLARLGGDEFVVVVAELEDAQDAMRVATQLIEAVRAPFHIDGHELFVSMSLGISIYPSDGTDDEMLMANADAAMYRAKDKGRDNFQWFAAEMNAIARERMDLESQLRYALKLGQLELHYQPKCGPSGCVQGFEALMRWNHPLMGMILPSRFIPLAEDSGMIVAMGEWALREACAQLVKWQQAGHQALHVAVNVSALQFRRPDWVETVRRALRETGLPPQSLELEITESLLLQNVTETSTNLFDLRALGVNIAIDDFGTGYSSLSYLHKLPVTTLKIDQSFVREIGKQSVPGQEEAPIIRTIIALARNFGMSVVAEGIETEAQRQLLVLLGCESLQGYLLYPPMTVADVEELLRDETTVCGPQDLI